MYKVNVMNPCSCFIKNGLADAQDFDTKAEAEAAAKNIMDKMQAEFCQRHNFSVSEQFGTYTVFIKARS
jgi:nucleoid DNA-binding protein